MPWKTAAYQSPFATAHTSVMAAKNGLPTLDSKQREIAKLELEISVQRAKLPTVRPNNIKQIQRSIATREAKVASLRQEILGVELNGSSSEASQDEICTKDTGGTLLIHITNKQSSSVAEQADEINPEGVGDIASDSVATDPKGILQRELIVSDYGQDVRRSETGVLSGEKTASILEAASEGSTIQESTSKSRGTKPLPVELIAAPVSPVIEQLNAASPIASTATETASMLYEPQGPPSGGSEHGDHHNFMANNHQGSSSLTGALGELNSQNDHVVTSGGSDVLNPGVPRLRLSLNSHRLQEEVAELLDGALGRHGNVKTYKSSHQSARRYSGESLSPGAKALMIDPYLDSTPATDQPSLSHVTPAPTTSINENLGFHPSAFLINPFQGSANVHHNHPRPLSVASIPNKSPEPTEENQSHASQPSVNQAPTSIEVKTHQSHQQAENAQSVILPHSGSNVISPLNTEDNVVQIEQQAPSVPPTTKHAVSSPNTGEQLCSEPLSSDALLQSRILSNSGQSPDAQDSVKRSTSTYELPPNPSTHEPPPNPSTHELPPNPVDAPPSSLPTMENCLVPAPMSENSLLNRASGSLPVKSELSSGKIQEFFDIAQRMGVTLVDLDGHCVEPLVTHLQVAEDVEMLDGHSPPESSHVQSNEKGKGQVEGRKKNTMHRGKSAGWMVKIQTSEGEKRKRSSDDDQTGELLDDYFGNEEDENSKSESKRKKPISKKRKEDEREYERCARLARDPATIKQAKREVADFITSGKKFSKDIKYLLQTVNFFVPECASICPELSMEILKTTQGTIRCLQHAYTRNSSQNDWTGSMRAWNVTGVPYRPRKAGEQLDNGALHCGCHWENAVFEFYLFKMGQIESRTQKDEPGWLKEGWGTQHFHPHLRELVLGQVQDITTWCLDDIWSRRKNEEGLYMVRRRESDKLQGLIDRLQAHLAVRRESEAREARAMEDTEEFIQQHEEGKARLQEDAPTDVE